MKHRILVIDDEEVIQRLLVKVLSSRHFEVDTAGDAGKAKELLDKQEYTVAIVDLGLTHPDYTGGLDVVKHIRARKPKTKILVYTGNADPRIRDLALKNGADLFLVKPVPIEILSRSVMRLCQSER